MSALEEVILKIQELDIEEVLQKHNCKTLEELYSRLTALTFKYERDLYKMLPRWEEFKSQLFNAPLLNLLDHLKAHDDAEREIMEILGELRKLKAAPTTNVDDTPLDLSPVEDVYTAAILFKKWECGMDMPGNYLNPMGLGYFNELFMAMYLGNYEDFIEILSSMTTEEIQRAMKERVGYLQVTPVFVPIIGLKMVKLDTRLTEREKNNLRIMYRVEGRHLEILEHLLKMGADVNQQDFLGCTPIFHCYNTELHDFSYSMCKLLLDYGLNPNIADRCNSTILWLCTKDSMINHIELLMSHGADHSVQLSKASGHNMTILQWAARKGTLKAFQSLIGARKLVEPKPKPQSIYTQSTITKNSSNQDPVDEKPVAEAKKTTYQESSRYKFKNTLSPSRNIESQQVLKPEEIKDAGKPVEKCWSCSALASKKCSGCAMVWYCSPACQKLDWTLHKLVCKFFKQRQK